MGSERMYYPMPDGTNKQINPFTGTEVWVVPSRINRLSLDEPASEAKPLEIHEPEDHCPFCLARALEVPPEKERLVLQGGQYEVLQHVPAEALQETRPVFRRVPNLFEIVTMDYWEKNHGYTISGHNLKWQDEYLGSPRGREHVLAMVDHKMRTMGKAARDIEALPEEAKLAMAKAFFAGSHEIIIPSRHYRADAQKVSDLYSAGEMTPDEHFQYMKFTIRAMNDIYEKNRYVRYISVFQNWLSAAGASFEHLHKQMVGLDEWGLSVEKEVELLQQNGNIYNEKVVNFACYHNFVVAENDYAIAFSDMGHRYPSLAVYSKSRHGRPGEHTDQELRGFSDLVHACHAASGSQTSCNEEWYYAPRDAYHVMPWHILVKWRITTHAGFEGGTRIYINPTSPRHLRDRIVPRLYDLRDRGRVAEFKIAEECGAKPNCLLYNRS